MNFIDLNKAYLKDPYPLSSIDKLIDGDSRFQILSFMDSYSDCNQIKKTPNDALKTVFMTNRDNFIIKSSILG